MTNTPLWVFGYGSLMWNPGFEPAEQVLARLNGFHRSFCMWSIHHRGSEEEPGLVLALDEADAACEGVAMRVADAERDRVLDYLRERELISAAYVEQVHDLELRDGRKVPGLCYVIERDHIQYCGGLELERQAQVIAKAVGGRGPNTEYLYNTAQQLDAFGIDDVDMEWLVARVRQLAG
ncbi:cation transport protein ChaC [Litoreibacter halocynthiae]|uniref:glutathione-specific gamma-glutamylcyclotransferase n=1 Tax=Litoreibacter halocynthiae TaxID=1242689 RepID=A0A4R7LHQ4_9RHOB|nr:gamma-glutamylcyclotransferase [Litoreibacter halocynthiae]TDT75298.1 cation transport protein ChaC [Litoreibacter halocynthiae]